MNDDEGVGYSYHDQLFTTKEGKLVRKETFLERERERETERERDREYLLVQKAFNGSHKQ